MSGDDPAGDWDFQDFDDGSLKAAKDNQLKKCDSFLNEHAGRLVDIENFVDRSSCQISRYSDSIDLELKPDEQLQLEDFVNSDNKVFNKVILTISALCTELSFIEDEAMNNFIPAILYYGEGEIENPNDEGRIPIHMGRFLPVFKDLLTFVDRAYEVVRHAVQQLACLYSANVKKEGWVINLKDVSLTELYNQLANVLRVLITLDELLSQPSALRDDWELYKRVLLSVKHDPRKFEFPVEKIRPFEKLMMSLEGKLLDDKIFQNCVEQEFNTNGQQVSNNATFADNFLATMRQIYSEVEPRLDIVNGYETKERLQFVGLSGLFCLYHNVFRKSEKKFYREIWNLHNKVPCVVLCGNVVWLPATFLIKRLPSLAQSIDRKSIQRAEARLTSWLTEKVNLLNRDVNILYGHISSWLMRMEGTHQRNPEVGKDVTAKANMMIQGLVWAFNLNHLVKSVLVLHGVLKKPMSKSLVLNICKIVELLKAIEFQFFRQKLLLAESLGDVYMDISYHLLVRMEAAKKKLSKVDKKSDVRKDLASALHLVEKSLNGPPTSKRLLLVTIVLPLLSRMSVLQGEDLTKFNNDISALKLLSDLDNNIRIATDCSFIYWHRLDIFPLYVNEIFKKSADINRIQFMLSALQDSVPGMALVKHLESPQQLLDFYENEVVKMLKDELLEPLCNEVENDLRFQIHSHLKLDDRNPFRSTDSAARDLCHFFETSPLRFLSRRIDVAAHVTRYLDRVIYDLTAVAPFNWRTYGEMKKVAQQKYRLKFLEPHLPSQTLEQGLDVLQIMRAIHLFVRKYNYNMNNQIFVEKYSKSKHLNTINIRHVANSIRTHGVGIMNTSVNFTYQYLKQKVTVFSNFLYDEHIKARLIKDWRHFKENHAHTDQKYPYDRASKMMNGIRKLGQQTDGKSYLDVFRHLVTEMGNAMGYVRMVRSGALNCISQAIRFVPDLEDVVNFTQLTKEASLRPETVQAAENLDEVLGNLTSSFSSNNDYFKSLVNVFAYELRSKRNVHLTNFFVILPALTINYIENLIRGKELLNRKNKDGALFTDDGFAMGVAYILKVLDQYHDFDSLHWFQSVRDYYQAERTKAEGMGHSQETLRLALKRMDNRIAEFELLFYSLSSARIFFRADLTASEEKAADAEAAAAETSGSSEPAATENAQGTSEPPAPPAAGKKFRTRL